METKDEAALMSAVAGAVNRRDVLRHAPEKDAEGYACPTELVGRTFLHGKRGTIYKVAGWAWDGERDLWMVVFHNVNSALSTIPYARKVANFTGRWEDGSRRYVEVHDVASVQSPAAAAALPPAVPLRVRAPQPPQANGGAAPAANDPRGLTDAATPLGAAVVAET